MLQQDDNSEVVDPKWIISISVYGKHDLQMQMVELIVLIRFSSPSKLALVLIKVVIGALTVVAPSWYWQMHGT